MDRIRSAIEFIGILFGIIGACMVFVYVLSFENLDIWTWGVVPFIAITTFSIGILNREEWARIGFLWSLLICFPFLAWLLIQLGGDWSSGVFLVAVFLALPVITTGIFLSLPIVKQRFN